jgi:DNA (cytosine-5)-methyltransferase 1
MEEKLNAKGYDLHKCVLNASYFGIPQRRERAYFVALRKDMKPAKKDFVRVYAARREIRESFLENIFKKEVNKDFIVNRNDIQILKKRKRLGLQIKAYKGRHS